MIMNILFSSLEIFVNAGFHAECDALAQLAVTYQGNR